MRRSFYQYMATLRGPNRQDPLTHLANELDQDLGFPKQSQDYEEISHYLEDNAYYVTNMDLFDQAWELYQEHND
ncbi:YozE family protein [Vagococcus humatus]|uniref:UPF0346 protein C7P63_01340 n=1 Tax=Vagococcus humatus TaxID=1889241 RepID=A0A3R9YDC7_9ENTE|nr:YozE family protein [Vagococcus humatus]RST89750.1 hypothetical protein C7P63_01340 [Vagococcus humatus]